MNLNGFLSMSGNVSGSLGADLVVDVEANPSGVATQPLIKLRVGDVIYAIPSGGGGGGTSDYNLLTNKPKINGVILQDELSLHSLGIQEEITFSGEATEYLNGEGYFSTPPGYIPINYDTAEQNTGIKWIDGKPLYQKTITFKAPSSNTYTQQSLGISDFDEIMIVSDASYAKSATEVITIDGYGSGNVTGDQIIGLINRLTKTFDYRVGSSIYSADILLTVQYTKVTD